MRPSELPEPDRWVAVDTETSGKHPDDGARVSVVSVAWEQAGEVRAEAFPFDQNRDRAQGSLQLEVDPNLGVQEWVALLGWLGRQELVFHNAKFDLRMLRAGTRLWAGVELIDQFRWDTMLGVGVLEPRAEEGLDKTAKRWNLTAGETVGKDEALGRYLKGKNKRYDLVPWPIMEPYAAGDAELTLRLFLLQLQQLEAGEGSLAQIAFRFDVMQTLYAIEARGVQYDWEQSEKLAVVIEKAAHRRALELPFPPTIDHARRYFFETKGVEPPKPAGKSGKFPLDQEVLDQLILDHVGWAQEWDDYQEMKRAESMWYKGYARMTNKDDGRLRTSFRQRVRTGRMSAERAQLHAIPKEDKALQGIRSVRQLIGARPGYVLWNLDLSQAELRVAAVYSRCDVMKRMLEDDGADIHGITCQQVLGAHPSDKDWKVKRDIAKRLTFGSIFQIGAKTFQATLKKLARIDMPLAQCDAIVRRWRRTYPEFGVAYNRAQSRAKRSGNVRLLAGTEYEELSWFGERDWPNTAWSRMVQGSLALFNQIWLLEVEQRWPGKIVLNVHDSLLLELEHDDDATAGLIAAWTEIRASALFKIEMKVDVGRWEDQFGIEPAKEGPNV